MGHTLTLTAEIPVRRLNLGRELLQDANHYCVLNSLQTGQSVGDEAFCSRKSLQVGSVVRHGHLYGTSANDSITLCSNHTDCES